MRWPGCSAFRFRSCCSSTCFAAATSGQATALQRLVVALAFVLVVGVVGRVVVGRIAHRELVVLGISRALRRPRGDLDRLLVVIVVVVPVVAFVVVVRIADRRFLVVVVVPGTRAQRRRPVERATAGGRAQQETHFGGILRFCPG